MELQGPPLQAPEVLGAVGGGGGPLPLGGGGSLNRSIVAAQKEPAPWGGVP